MAPINKKMILIKNIEIVNSTYKVSNPEATQKCPLHSIVKKSYFQQVGAKNSITSENKKQIFKENYGSSSGQSSSVEDINSTERSVEDIDSNSGQSSSVEDIDSNSGQSSSVEDIDSNSGQSSSVEDIDSNSGLSSRLEDMICSSPGQSRSVEDIVERYNTRINNVKSSFDITLKSLTRKRGIPFPISFKESIDKIVWHRNLIFVTSHNGPYKTEFIPIDPTYHLRKEQLSTNLEFVALVLHIISVRLDIPAYLFGQISGPERYDSGVIAARVLDIDRRKANMCIKIPYKGSGDCVKEIVVTMETFEIWSDIQKGRLGDDPGLYNDYIPRGETLEKLARGMKVKRRTIHKMIDSAKLMPE